MQIVPRVYQKAAVKAALVGLRGRLKRALVVLATGLGKTLTAALIAKEFRGKRILFLVHNNFILKHAVDEFQLVFDKKTKVATYNGMSKDGAKEANIVFSTWQTMNGSLRKWVRDHFDLIIVDEAHHSEADTYRPVLDYFDAPKLGITATPERQDKADIRDVFGPEVINITLEEAIARGWLPRIEYHVITDESLDEGALQKIAGEILESKRRFTMAEVNRRIFIKKRDVEIARIINGYDEKSVVFCASIAHAERIAKSLKLAATFHSKKGNSPNHTWKQNQETLDHLKNGIIRRVCAVNAFNEGVNVPSVGLVAFCRVTGAVTIFRQQLGRGLRPGKEKLIVLDFVGNLERVQLVLGMMNRISDLHEEYTSKDEIQREGYVRQKFEVSGRGFEFTFSDRVVDLMRVLEHCERGIYSTWQEASKVVQIHNFPSREEYKRDYKKIDPSLPMHPNRLYDDFPGWSIFLRGSVKLFYKTYAEAQQATKKLGLSCLEYLAGGYMKDPLLPADPSQRYSEEWKGWTEFLGTVGRKSYKTCKQAMVAARQFKFVNKKDYQSRCRSCDPLLPVTAHTKYKNFPGWKAFLGKSKK